MHAGSAHHHQAATALPYWAYGLLAAIVVVLLSTVVLVLVVLDGRHVARDDRADTGLGLLDALSVQPA